MAGWESPNRELIIWDGTVKAKKLLTTDDIITEDTAYVALVLYGTDATPPTASLFPIGTIYIKYSP